VRDDLSKKLKERLHKEDGGEPSENIIGWTYRYEGDDKERIQNFGEKIR
jgi:hypothetical protein